MKEMKKSFGILLVALLATGMSLTAQHRGNGAPKGEGARMGKPGMGVLKELNLTDEQKAIMKVMHEGFAAQDSVSREQFKKQRQAVQSERQLALNKILTTEQLLQLDKMRVEKEQAVGKNGHVGPGNRQEGLRQGGFAGQGRNRMMGQGHGQMVGNGNQMMGQGHGQMVGNNGQMMGQPGQMGGQMMQNGAPMNRGMQMGNGCPRCNGKAFLKHAKRMNAGPRINPEIRIKNQVEHMTKLLDLTPEQAAQIQAIQLKDAKKEIAAYQKIQKKHDAQLKIRTAKHDEIKAVLTPEQVKKLDALKEHAPKMQRMEGPMNGPMQGRK